MLRYLKAAFLVREPISFLGDVPVNVAGVVAMAVLGLGHPAFWLLGLFGETAYLWATVANPRFRRLVDALDLQSGMGSATEARDGLSRQLDATHTDRFAALQAQFTEVQSAYSDFAAELDTAAGNLRQLRELEWLYLKLLLAHQHLLRPRSKADEESLLQEVEKLRAELESAQLSSALRSSKEATLELLHKRLAAARQRKQTFAEIEGDLERIEAQFLLAVESAAIRARPEDLQLNLELASSLITIPEFFGVNTDEVMRAESQGAKS